LVDDSADLRSLCRLWLTAWGFAVEEARHGAEAVAKARAHRLTCSPPRTSGGAMDGFACVFCAEAIEPTLDQWLWVEITSRTELMTAHQTCYDHASKHARPSCRPSR
jgi:CheY-like chemotaxis protein